VQNRGREPISGQLLQVRRRASPGVPAAAWPLVHVARRRIGRAGGGIHPATDQTGQVPASRGLFVKEAPGFSSRSFHHQNRYNHIIYFMF
jgi:hypothetical protein